MGWIDDDKQELERQRHTAAELKYRSQQIASASGTVYKNLWDEVWAGIVEAENKGIANILTNGSPFDRVLICPQKPKPGMASPAGTVTKPKRVTISLSQDQQAIAITGDSKIRFALDFGNDNVVLLKHDGEFIDVKEAAKLILRPLLFPELYGNG